ncbi:TraB/GumN family protein [Comamonas serinivorans]|nr:TraB/GumN family protein [Comamonas serinivorans]
MMHVSSTARKLTRAAGWLARCAALSWAVSTGAAGAAASPAGSAAAASAPAAKASATAVPARAASAATAPALCPETPQLLGTAELRALQRAQPAAPDRGLLWQVEKNGQRGWLYGTMHLGRKPWLQLGPRLQQALARVDVLALEVDLTDPRTQQEMAATSRATAGKPVGAQADAQAAGRAGAAQPDPAAADAAPPDARQQQRMAAQLQRVCLPPQALAGAASHLQAAALMVLAARSEGLHAEYGSERVLALLAKAQGKRVVAVEDVRSQTALLKGEDAQADAAQLDDALDELESGRGLQQLRRLGVAWAAGDVDTLTRYHEWCDCIHSEADRQAQDRVLTARNGPMADAFERLLREGQSVLLAVGALHMVGPQGVAAELSQRGYRVTRVVD